MGTEGVKRRSENRSDGCETSIKIMITRKSRNGRLPAMELLNGAIVYKG